MSSQPSNYCTDLRVIFNELLWLHVLVYITSKTLTMTTVEFFESNINLCQQIEFTFIKLIVELYSSFFEFKCQRYWQNYSSKWITYLGASDFFFCLTPTWSISATQTLVRMQLIWCCMLHVWKHSTMRGSRALKRKYHQIQGNFMQISP